MKRCLACEAPFEAADWTCPNCGYQPALRDEIYQFTGERPGLHAGSTAVRDFIEKYQPEHFFCGHIHEAEGAAIRMGKTRARNVGKAGFLLELAG